MAITNPLTNTAQQKATVLSPFIVNGSSLEYYNAATPLWKLSQPTDTNSLPILVRNTNVSNTANGSTQTTSTTNQGIGIVKNYGGVNVAVTANEAINVVNDFDWTVSLGKTPSTNSRIDVPVITLAEYRLLMNSNISNLANSIYASTQNFSKITNTAYDTFFGVGEGDGTNAQSSVANNILSQVNNFSNTVDTYVQGQLFNVFNNKALSPYNYLYATESTGFVYKLPYLDDSFNSFTNSFGAGETNFASGLTNIIGDIASSTSALANIIKPGTYIEKAKQYSMGDTGRTVTVKFPLLNTLREDAISLNWQLLYGLIYQNRPGRIDRSVIDMPVIYSAYLRGMFYMPYCYISNLTVSFLGARRLATFDVPVQTISTNDTTQITTIVPDAYVVSITLTGMNEETRNFMYASINPASVTVSQQQLPQQQQTPNTGSTTITNPQPSNVGQGINPPGSTGSTT